MPIKAPSKQPEMKWFKVVKERDHGGLIHGMRRKIDDAFEAPETAMTFDVLEGLVVECDPPAQN